MNTKYLTLQVLFEKKRWNYISLKRLGNLEDLNRSLFFKKMKNLERLSGRINFEYSMAAWSFHKAYQKRNPKRKARFWIFFYAYRVLWVASR